MTEVEQKKIEEQTEEILEKIVQHDKDETKYRGEQKTQSAETKLFMKKATTDLEKIEALETAKTEMKTELEEKEKRLVLLEKKFKRPVDGDGIVMPENRIIEKKALNQFIRSGGRGVDLADEELKTGNVSLENLESLGIEFKIASAHDDPDTGYLKKEPTLLTDIIKHITEYSPVRQYATVITSDRDIMAPKRTAVATATGRREAGSISEETTRKYGLEVMAAHEMVVRFDAYYWMIEDSAFDLEAEATSDAGEAFAFKEGSGFINGTAIGEPEGIMQNSDITSRNQEETDDITGGDALIQLAYDINDQYTMNPNEVAYMCRRASLGKVRVLKGGDGQYLMERMDEAGKRRIEGYPVITAPDMDAIGANTYPFVFGNFKKGYWILDRMSMWVLKDPYTNAADGYVRYLFRRRVNGQVVQHLAFKKLYIHVT